MSAPHAGELTARANMRYLLDKMNNYPRVMQAQQYTSQRIDDLKDLWENSRMREYIMLDLVPYTSDQSFAATVLFFSVIPLIIMLSGILATFGSITFGFTLIQLSVAVLCIVVVCLTAAIPLIIIAAILVICYRAYLYNRSLVTSVVENFHVLYHYYAALYLPKIIRDVTGL